MKPGRLWVPVDVGYWRDPQVLQAGEPAAVLYLALLMHLRTTGSAIGVVSRAEVEASAPLRGQHWRKRMSGLLVSGMVQEADESGQTYLLPAWSGWQSSRAGYMREWRAKQSQRDDT